MAHTSRQSPNLSASRLAAKCRSATSGSCCPRVFASSGNRPALRGVGARTSISNVRSIVLVYLCLCNPLIQDRYARGCSHRAFATSPVLCIGFGGGTFDTSPDLARNQQESTDQQKMHGNHSLLMFFRQNKPQEINTLSGMTRDRNC